MNIGIIAHNSKKSLIKDFWLHTRESHENMRCTAPEPLLGRRIEEVMNLFMYTSFS